jgi:hypothetical protein
MKYTTRPISDRTPFTGQHKPNPFRATWSDTLQLLDAELGYLDARDVVFEVDVVDESQIRLDGMLRSGAKVESPAVRLAFDSRYGPLTYATDRFRGQYYSDPPDWQINLRAIALGLEALRKVDRYGITKRGEQYTGWKALPAGRAMPASHMTSDEASRLLYEISGCDAYAPPEDAWRRARAKAHPDRNEGDRALWDQVEQAAAVLGLAS